MLAWTVRILPDQPLVGSTRMLFWGLTSLACMLAALR
jgi:hypothetical protein